MSSEKFCLRWNDFESNISSAFKDIRDEKEFFDVTVACEDEQLQAHKVILSACSPFFKNVLRRNQHQHPLLYLKGVSFRDMEAVLNFMYHGEVNVAQDDLNSFLQVAEDLRIKGLTQSNSGNVASAHTNQQPLAKSEPKADNHRPRPAEHGITSPPKRPRPPPQAPSRVYPQPVAQQADDIEVIVPVVKSEPREIAPTAQPTVQPTVQPTMQPMVEQTMAMYEEGAQQETMMEQYDDHYGGEYDGQYVDQGYDTSMGGQGGHGGQDGTGTGVPSTHEQCPYCFKSIHKATIRRHIKNQHGDAGSVKCNFCDGVFKNETSLKDHLRQKHNVYQSVNNL